MGTNRYTVIHHATSIVCNIYVFKRDRHLDAPVGIYTQMKDMETSMSLKNTAIGLNVLLMLLCVGFFAGHGLPKSLMLWSSAILWFVAPIVTLLYIRKNP